MAGTEQEVRIGVSPADFFKVVTDYESYPEFLDEMEGVKVPCRAAAEVQFTVNLIKRVTYTLLLTETEPHRSPGS